MNVYAKHGAKNVVEKVVIYIILIFFTFMALYPLFWLAMSSFKSTQDYQLSGKLSLPVPRSIVYKLGEKEKVINNDFLRATEEEFEAIEDITKDMGLFYPIQLTAAEKSGKNEKQIEGALDRKRDSFKKDLIKIESLAKTYDFINPTDKDAQGLDELAKIVAKYAVSPSDVEGLKYKSWIDEVTFGLGWSYERFDRVQQKEIKPAVYDENGDIVKPAERTPYLSVWDNRNYPGAWVRGNFNSLFLNSILYTVVTTLAILYFSIACGFAFSKLKSKATGFFYKSFVIGVLITIQCILIPLFFMANWTGLYDTRTGILIVYIGIGLPMGVYLATEFVRSIPTSLIESARIDGAQFLKIFFSIIFPMAKPVGVTLAILNIAGTWNEFMLVNILASSENIKSLPVGIQKFSGALASDFGKQFAALVIGIIPMVIFYIVFRKQITKGVAAGAVKG